RHDKGWSDSRVNVETRLDPGAAPEWMLRAGEHTMATMTTMLAALLVVALGALQHPSMPAGMSQEDHLKQMQKEAHLKHRGDAAMGFDQDKTTHRFQTRADGGAIEVDVKDPSDTASLAQVRAHLKEIAASFKSGDFGKPMETHAEVPPGVPVMQRLAGEIASSDADTPRGGAVTIRTANTDALAAVHEFLEYQIKEHHTARERRASAAGQGGVTAVAAH